MCKPDLDYTKYNREERDICAHLFRLLLEDQPRCRPLCQFLGVESVTNPRLFCEVALIRDAYYARKPDSSGFMSDLVDLVAQQQHIDNYTRFKELPVAIRDPGRTHPKQIRHRLRSESVDLPESDNAVYGAVQAMFNAKPDLAICAGEDLFIYEAKYTLDFDREQLRRTAEIGDVWSRLLFRDLGYDSPPNLWIRTLGLECFSPDVSWESVWAFAKQQWGDADYSTRILEKVR